MKKANKIILFFFILLLLNGFTSCNDTDCDLPENADSVIINDRQGTIFYSEEYKKWGIRSHASGTIDVVDFFLIKNMDNDYEQEGLPVKFSGEAHDLEIEQPRAGTTIYCCHLSQISKTQQ